MKNEGRRSGVGQSDPAAWLSEHGDALFRYALLRLGSRSAAEDAVQETLMAALEARDSFAARSSERTWLFGVLKHKVLDQIRRAVRDEKPGAAESDPAERLFDQRGLWKAAPAKWGKDPAQTFERQEFWAVFFDCLDGLPPHMASAFTLRERGELEADKICKILGVTATNLWTMLHRARARLRECLESNWFKRGGEARA
jgi:RNA polymerase sigma-70 factor (ECF subfamily)